MKAIGTLLKAIGGMAVFLVLAYLLYFGGQDLIPRRSPAPPAPVTAPVVTAQARPDSFTAVVDAARPAVVNMSTLRGQRTGQDPVREFLERYFGERIPEEPTQSLGSGVIIDPSGFVLTNNHVIEGARMIMVLLADERGLEGEGVG